MQTTADQMKTSNTANFETLAVEVTTLAPTAEEAAVTERGLGVEMKSPAAVEATSVTEEFVVPSDASPPVTGHGPASECDAPPADSAGLLCLSPTLVLRDSIKDLPTVVETTTSVWEGSASAELARSVTGSSLTGSLDRITRSRSRGEKTEKKLKWWQALFILIASTISLGVLSLPSAVASLGLLPGVFAIAGMGAISFYTGGLIQAYMERHPGTKSFSDLVEICWPKVLGGARGGRITGGVLQNAYLFFIMAAHVNIWGTAMSMLESPNSSTCFLFLAASGAVAIFAVTAVAPLKECAPVSVVSCVSVISAIVLAIGAVGREGVAHNWYNVVDAPLLSTNKIFLAISNIVLSFVGHTMYPSVISEMARPKEFKKALVGLELVKVVFYILVAALFFVFVGPHVPSPALGSAPNLFAKISYGLAIPTIIVAGAIPAVIVAGDAERMIWKSWLKRPQYVQNRGWHERDEFISVLAWAGLLLILWTLAWALAVAVPVFSELLGLMGAIFATVFGLGFPSVFFWQMWLQDRKTGKKSTRRWLKAKMAANVVFPVLCVAVMVIGTWGSAVSIKDSSAKESRGPFSCTSPQLVAT